MKILVAGAGAVGTFLGGKLALAGHQAVFYHPREAYCKILNENPVEIFEKETPQYGRVAAFSNFSNLFRQFGDFDLAILAVKSQVTRALCEELSPYFSHIEHFLSIQNGLGNEEILLESLEPSRITAGSLTLACSLLGEGKVSAEGRGGIAMASLSHTGYPAPAEIFRKADFQVQVISDWRRMKWSKLLLNITGNATCALLDMSAEEIFSNHSLFQIERQALREAIRVMEAHEIRPVNLPGFPVPLFVQAVKFLPPSLLQFLLQRKIRKARGSKLASLQLDFLKGKRETEAPFLYGVLVRRAAEKGMKAPVLQRLSELLEEVGSGKIARETFRKKPGALLKEFA